ncbi:MAG: hydrogenase formation protein HypD [Deltaproteobacteria bacterium]|nr:hydrogenase formation protein HypD [Deltaproteobacteria bacterium]
MNGTILEGFRDRDLVRGLAARIRKLVAGRPEPMTFMEVCGTHTMAIYQFGIRSLLPPEVQLISGPGCPVCVTPVGYVDRAVAYARLPETIVATFGDLVRVPGSTSSLMRERAKGADVRVVYSPLDALSLAEKSPGKRVVFLGVGFETTTPTVAGAILLARTRGLGNFFVLAAHKTIPIPMEVLSADPELGIDGYLCPAHVSTIIGADAYRPLAEEHGVPCVVTGFEPADLLHGVAMLAAQVTEGRRAVEIQYRRFVTPEGNGRARELVSSVFAPADAVWRGLGVIPGSGLRIADEFAAFDAERAVPVATEEPREPRGCRCGEVLKGKLAPAECPLFGAACTPEEPVGACMVSSEGSCAAAYRYGDHG